MTPRPNVKETHVPSDPSLDIEELVRVAALAGAEKKATDVVALRVGPLLVVTDFFLIMAGANDRQVHAIGDAIEGALRDRGRKPIGREGERELKWLLLDYGDFVVHVFQPEEREFYRLDKLWGDVEHLALPAGVTESVSPASAGAGQGTAS
jgi:ribosome-associated protein